VWEVLYESSDKEHTWLVMEEHFIREHNTHANEGHGYNYSFGGYGPGKIIKETTKEKMRQAKLGRKQSAKHVAKRVLKITGQKRTDETCKKISAANLGREHSDESKRNMSNGQKKPYEIEGVVYMGLAAAAAGLNISKGILMRKMKRGEILWT
jgi:hypothetical protein